MGKAYIVDRDRQLALLDEFDRRGNRIATLEAENKRLKIALEHLIDEVDGPDKECELTTGELIALEEARAALAGVD